MNRLHQELLKDFQVFGQNAPTAKSLMERFAYRLHEKMAKSTLLVIAHLAFLRPPGSGLPTRKKMPELQFVEHKGKSDTGVSPKLGLRPFLYHKFSYLSP